MTGLTIILDACEELLANSRPSKVAREWLASHPNLTSTWEIAKGQIAPRPLDDGAHKLVDKVSSFTGCIHTLAETVAHLFDHADGSSHAVWCWQEGDREYIRVEPRPVWAAAT